jgi:hypothetical protein
MRTITALLVVAALWVICGVVSGALAARKGRGVRRWAILGLILGPIGVVAHAFYPARYVATGTPCPRCGKSISTRSVACHHCQYRFPSMDVVITSAPEDPEARRLILNELAREYGIQYADAGKMLTELPVAGYRHVMPDQVDELVKRLETAGASVRVVPSSANSERR